MGVCWHCYWGWPKQVSDIYDAALAKLPHDGAMLYGPAHIVWADENFDDGSIRWCLDHFDDYRHGYSEAELAIVRESLVQLLRVPEEIRCEPEDYDDEHPENYPPATGLEMVKR